MATKQKEHIQHKWTLQSRPQVTHNIWTNFGTQILKQDWIIALFYQISIISMASMATKQN